MSIKVIAEFKATPGNRDELKALLEGMVAQHEPSMRGFLGITRYEVLDDPDRLVEIADWSSAEAREQHIQASAVRTAFAPIRELLATPASVTLITEFGQS